MGIIGSWWELWELAEFTGLVEANGNYQEMVGVIRNMGKL